MIINIYLIAYFYYNFNFIEIESFIYFIHFIILNYFATNMIFNENLIYRYIY